VKRTLILVLVGAGIVTLILGCERSAKKASSTQLPLIPETDPLAQPKSLRQVGAPVELTRRPGLTIRGRTFVALLGPSIEEGIAGFGDSVQAALRAFDAQYSRSLTRTANRA
jgi:hypothetical protein